MLPARHIAPPGWMSHEDAVSLMTVLGGFDSPPKAMFVGGCVRNTLSGKPVSDIDIATVHRPDMVMTMLLQSGIRAIPTGLDHGTVTAVFPSGKYEITTLRKDVETDGRHAVIAFSEDWDEDARRRDFTMNTLFADAGGQIYDPTGEGIRDLENNMVRFVGAPAERIAEDHLRILRFFRFHAQYGGETADPAAIEACAAHADSVGALSRERITQEFLKILESKRAAEIITLMFSNGVLKDMPADGYRPGVLETLVGLQRREDCIDVTARLFVLGGFGPYDFSPRLVLSNEQKRHYDGLGKALATLDKQTKKKMREAVYRLGKGCALQAYLVALAQKEDLPDLEMIDIARYWHPPTFPINGTILMEKGMRAGKDLGDRLHALEEKWIASDFTKLPKI